MSKDNFLPIVNPPTRTLGEINESEEDLVGLGGAELVTAEIGDEIFIGDSNNFDITSLFKLS